MKHYWIGNVILGIGLIIGTVLALITDELGWVVLSGPIFVALTTVVEGAFYRRFDDSNKRIWRAAIVGLEIIAAAAIVAIADPAYVVVILPIIGGPSVMILRSERCKTSQVRI